VIWHFEKSHAKPKHNSYPNQFCNLLKICDNMAFNHTIGHLPESLFLQQQKLSWRVSKEISREKLSFVCLSPPTPPSVWKLEGWNFAFSLLILMPKKLRNRFLNFSLGYEILLFFYFYVVYFLIWSLRNLVPHHATIFHAGIGWHCAQVSQGVHKHFKPHNRRDQSS